VVLPLPLALALEVGVVEVGTAAPEIDVLDGELPLVVVDTPPVMVLPVIGTGVLMSVDDVGGRRGEDEPPPLEILAMTNEGLVLPESPNKTMR